MSLDVIVLIISVIVSIIDIILVIINYKYFEFHNHPKTIGTLIEEEWEWFIISIVPGINAILFIMLSAHLIWELIKDIKL